MFYPLLVLSLVAASSASQSCYEYCITQPNPEESHAPKDCNCYTPGALDIKEPSKPLDDTGVYFEPAEESLFQEQFNTKPFHISNPIKVVTKIKRSKVKDESMSNKEFSYESVGLLKEETIIEVHTYEKNKASPTYLDLEVDSTASSKEGANKISLIEDLKSTERSLEECLDFHVINYTRKHGIAEKFKDYFEARNLKVYEHLSDSDLVRLLQQYCTQSEFIIEESLREIMRSQPKKKVKVGKDNQQIVGSEHAMPIFERSSNNVLLNTSLSENEVSRTDSSLVYAETTESIDDSPIDIDTISTENPTYSYNLTPIMDSVKNTEEVEREENITRSSIEYSNGNNNDTFVPYVTEITERTIKINDSSNLTTSSSSSSLLQNEFINSDILFDLDTMPSEVFYTTYTEINKNSHDKDFDSITPATNYDILTTISTAPVTNSENRNALTEAEIKLPKIISNELINNTVQSFIDGYEELPNNDFSEDPGTDKDNDVPYPESIFETTEPNSTMSEDNYISGNLYFGSSQELVPVRLLHSEGGKINLALSGDTLCDKLIKNTNKKSRLLSTLCECVRKNMVQNSTDLF